MAVKTGDLREFAKVLSRFKGRKELSKILRKEIRRPLPRVRRAIRKNAIQTLPKRGGVNRWVAASRINAIVKLTGRGAEVRLRGSRKNQTPALADLNRLDRTGRLRHPTYGRRGRGFWHTQVVRPGWFSTPAGEVDQWARYVNLAVQEACEVIARGR